MGSSCSGLQGRERRTNQPMPVPAALAPISRQELRAISSCWRLILEDCCPAYLLLKIEHGDCFSYHNCFNWYNTVLFDRLEDVYPVSSFFKLLILSSFFHNITLPPSASPCSNQFHPIYDLALSVLQVKFAPVFLIP